MTQSPVDVGWVAQPDGRGTIDIIWSCLLTVFVCCWTIVHPSIAEPGCSARHKFLDKTICLAIAAMAPEVIVFISWTDYMEARGLTRRLSVEPHVGANWTMTHSFFAQMGGFSVSSTSRADASKAGWVGATTILALVNDGRMDPSEIPTRPTIEDKGKADSLVKVVALVQALWLLVQCIARAVQHLPITTIEIATVAYIPCAVLISFFWWHKPMDVNEPIPLHLLPVAVQQILNNNNNNNKASTSPDDIATSTTVQTYGYTAYPLARESAATVLSVLERINLWGLLTVFFCLLFGGVHCLAWNFHFPTPTERLLWRICSLVISFSIPGSWLLSNIIVIAMEWTFPSLWYDFIHGSEYRETSGWFPSYPFHRLIHGTGLGLYVIARMYLVVEMFSSLRSQPDGVYKTVEWTNFWPHG